MFEELSQAVIDGEVGKAKELTEKLLAQQVVPEYILHKGLLAGMDVVGQRFKAYEMYIPEVLLSARAMHAAMEVLQPQLVETGAGTIGSIVAGTVAGDLHDIGKNLVLMMMEGSGFQVIDLGTDVTPERFVQAVRDHQPDLLGMSALLTTTMPHMGDTIKALEEAGVRDRVKVIVGGAPLTQEFAEDIGADAYAPDATTAVEKVRQLLGK